MTGPAVWLYAGTVWVALASAVYGYQAAARRVRAGLHHWSRRNLPVQAAPQAQAPAAPGDRRMPSEPWAS